MIGLSYVTFGIAVLLYAAASTLFYLDVARGTDVAERTRGAPLFLGVAAASHATYVSVASFVHHVCPVHSVHFILSIASLVATTTYLVARVKYKLNALGLLVAPIGLIVVLGTFFLGAVRSGSSLPAAFTGFHVFASLVGFALFLLASGTAIMYLVQERRLKSRKKQLTLKKTGGLPPLEALDKAVHRFLLAGFPLLTIALISGTVWAHQLEQGAPEFVFRIVFGYATWLLFAGVLLLRAMWGWRGRRAAYGTVAGFACEMLVLGFYLMRPLLSAAG